VLQACGGIRHLPIDPARSCRGEPVTRVMQADIAT
jgi:hypothetical protein